MQKGAAIQVLTEGLRSEDDTDRFLAALELRAIGPPARSALESLRKLLTDEDELVRKVAAEAIAAIEKRADEGEN